MTSAGGNTTYTYDSRNRLITATTENGSSTYTYTDDNKQDRVAYANGTITRYNYDNADRVLDVINERVLSPTQSETISQFVYTYDDNSNRLSQTETQAGFAQAQVQTTAYSYDRANRMTGYAITDQDTGNVQTLSYTFDNNYNRIGEVETLNTNGTTTTAKDRTSSFDANNRITQIIDNLDNETIDYVYDNNGNTLTKTDNTQAAPEITSFIYDSRNQLVQLTRGPPSNQTSQGLYDYDAKGMRIRHLQSERGDVEYTYDGRSILEEREINSDALIAHYRYSDRLISLNTPTDEQYYHYSALRTTTNLTNTQGQTQVSYRTDVWGNITEQQGQSPNRQVFTGQEHDENTGLVYFGARYYDPDTGRFINEDTYLGESMTPPSLHRYLYAYGNPSVYVDLYGYKSVSTMLHDAEMNADSALGAFGYRFLSVSMQFGTLGFMSIHDPQRDAYSRGDISGVEYGVKGIGGGIAMVAANAATGRAAGAAATGKNLATQTAISTGAGAALGAGNDIATQASNISAGTQESYNIQQTLISTATGTVGGAAVPSVARSAGTLVDRFGRSTQKTPPATGGNRSKQELDLEAENRGASSKTDSTITKENIEGGLAGKNQVPKKTDASSTPPNTYVDSHGRLRATKAHQQRTNSFVASEGDKSISTAEKLRRKQSANFNSQRDDVLKENDGICQYCQQRVATQVDHVDSIKNFADKVDAEELSLDEAAKLASSRENLIGACGGKGGCNPKKGSMPLGSDPNDPNTFTPTKPTEKVKPMIPE